MLLDEAMQYLVFNHKAVYTVFCSAFTNPQRPLSSLNPSLNVHAWGKIDLYGLKRKGGLNIRSASRWQKPFRAKFADRIKLESFEERLYNYKD